MEYEEWGIGCDSSFLIFHSSLSWGGATDALTSQNGANLHIEAGNYTFELYPQCDGKGYVNITKN